jgi:hypothetical protein
MLRHGDHSPFGPSRLNDPLGRRPPAAETIEAAAPAVGDADGFSALIDPPPGVERPDTSAAIHNHCRDVKAYFELLAKLGARMLDWNVPSSAAPPSELEKRTAPAGYTYLGQFIAHDLSFAAERTPVSAPKNVAAEGLDNLREAQLRLETIYGGGPRAFPLAYVCQLQWNRFGRTPETRTHFRLGRVEAPPSGNPPAQAGADLPRLSCPMLDGRAPTAGPGPVPATDVLIADPRNDDHALISQMAVLFCRLHNRIADALTAKLEAHAATHHGRIDYLSIFDRARAATTWVYQTIIWNDYLRRMIDGDVYGHYAPSKDDPARSVAFLTRQQRGSVPVEFSHAAFRYGHAMVRDKYKLAAARAFELDEILQRKSLNHPELMPFDTSWLVNWHNFFDRPGASGEDPRGFMRSRPLGPSITPMGSPTVFLSGETEADGEGEVMDITVTKSGQRIAATGMATRDLLRSCSMPMASVEAVLAVMAGDPSLKAIIDRHPLLADKAERERLIRAWLDAKSTSGIKDVEFGEDLEFLTANPPLFFFVLFEAGHIGKGLKLGPVGSFVVAETILWKLATPDNGQADGFRHAGYGPLLQPSDRVRADLAAAVGPNVPETMIALVDALAA